MWRIVSSPFGLSLMAIRDNPEKATYLGISVKKYRWYAFVISGAYAAVGGVLLAPVVGQVDPTLTYWTHSGTLVFMTLLGGFSTFLGPMLGAVIYIFLQDTGHVTHPLLEVRLRRHACLYRDRSPWRRCRSDRLVGKKGEKEWVRRKEW